MPPVAETTVSKINQTSLVIREEAFCGWLGKAEPGERIEYHRGCLCLDRDRDYSQLSDKDRRELIHLADRVASLAEEGRLILTQRRVGESVFSYFAAIANSPAQRERIA